MTIEELSKIANEEYIQNPIELAQKLNILDDKEYVEFLNLVFEYNKKIISRLKNDISFIKSSNKKTREFNFNMSNYEEYKDEDKSDNTDNELSKKAKEIILSINSCTNMDITSLLPSKDNSNYHSIINELLVHYLKDIVFLNNYMLNFYNELTSDELKELKIELEKARYIFETIKSNRQDNENEEDVITNEPPILIYLETPNGNTYFHQDILKLPTELYINFLKIFESFISGKETFIKHMANYKNLSCIKNKMHQARIYIMNITDNIYIVLGALNKKTDWSKSESIFVLNRYARANLLKDLISSKINDQSFLDEQQEKTQKALKLLRGE